MNLNKLYVPSQEGCVCVCIYVYVCVCIYEEFIGKNRWLFLTIFKNHVFSVCIPINLNQTAVGLFWLG